MRIAPYSSNSLLLRLYFLYFLLFTKYSTLLVRFVIDPSCFGKTIENMFHVSFLVKEQKAKMLIEDGAPLIRPFKVNVVVVYHMSIVGNGHGKF